MFFFFNQKTAYEMRISDWIQTCALPICNYRHYMLKEIYEQPAVMGDTINTVIGPTDRLAHLPDLGIDLGSITRIPIVACGTSYYSGLVAKYWLERSARIGVAADVATEFRYCEAPVARPGPSDFRSEAPRVAHGSTRTWRSRGAP